MITQVELDRMKAPWIKLQAEGAALGKHAQELLRLITEIEALQAILRDCANDLEAEIKHRYGNTLDYPSQKRKYDGDMSTVHEARAMLEGTP